MIEPEDQPRTAVPRLPQQVCAALRTACRALAGTEAEVTAVDLVSHLPDGIPASTLLASVRGIAAEYGCRASVAVANGTMEVRVSREGTPRR